MQKTATLSCRVLGCALGLFLLFVAACLRVADTGTAGAGSTLIASPDVVVADGTAAREVSAVVRDAGGGPLPGRRVTLHAADGNLRLTQPAPTDAAGRAMGQARTTVAGAYEVTASFLDAGQRVLVGAPLRLVFVTAPEPQGAGPAAPEVSLVATPNVLVADQVATTLLRVAGRDATGAPLVGAQVALSGTVPRDALEVAEPVLGADGTWTAALRSTLAGPRTLVADVAGQRALADVTFVAGAPDLRHSALLFAAADVAGDGIDVQSLTVVLRDVFDNPVPNRALSLSSDTAGVSFVPPTALSDANGRATVLVRSAVVGTVTVGAAVVPAAAPAPGANGAPTAPLQLREQATFALGPPALATSSLVVLDANTVADGRSLAALRLVVADAVGHPLPGIAVALSSPNGVVHLLADGATTSSDGALSLAATSVVVGALPVVATAQNVTLTAEVPFVAGPVDAARSTLLPATQAATVGEQGGGQLVLSAKDAWGHPASGRSVRWAAYPAGPRFTPPSGTTDANGTLSVGVVASVSGDGVVLASVDRVTLQAGLHWTAGVATAARSTLAATPASFVANGVATSTVTLALGDAFGNSAPNRPVTLATDAPGVALDATTGATDAAGLFRTAARGTVAQAANVVATLPDGNLWAALALQADSPNGTRSTLQAAPSAGLLADGNAAAALSFWVRDAFGNAVTNQPTRLAVDLAGATLQAGSGVTDGSGLVRTVLRSTRAGTATVTATAAGATVAVAVGFVPGPPEANACVLAVAPAVAVADGVAQATVSLTVRDARNNPVDNVAVSFSTGLGVDTLTPSAAVTDALGNASATWRTAVAGTRVVRASVAAPQGPVVLQGAVRFVAGAVDATMSRVDVTPATLIAGGGSAAVVVQLRDAYGNAASGVPSSLVAMGGNVSASPATAVSDGNGRVRAGVGGTGAGPKQLVVAAGGVQLTAPWTLLPAAPDAAHGRLDVAPPSAVADGSAAMTARLLLRDAFDNPVPGVGVSLTAGLPGPTAVAMAGGGVTDANGTAVALLRSTAAGTRSLTARAGDVVYVAPLVFVAGPPSVATSSLTAEPNAVTADGANAAHLRLWLRDATGNAVSGAALTLASDGAGDVFVPAGALQTASDGSASATVQGHVAGPRTLTASGSGVNLQASLRLLAGPADTAHSSLVATPASGTVADGVQAAALDLAAADAFGNAVAGQAFRLSCSLPGARLVPDNVAATNVLLAADANGRWSGAVVNTVAGVQICTADLGSTSVAATLGTVAGPADAAHSSLELSPDVLVDDGNQASALMVTLADAQGNPLAGVGVAFSSTGAGVVLDANAATTAQDGTASVGLRATVQGLQQVQADVAGLSLTANVRVVAGDANAQTSTLVAFPTPLVAQAGSTSLVTLQVADASGAPVPGQAANFTVAGAGAALSTDHGTTDGNGRVALLLSATTLGTATVRARINDVTVVRTVAVVAGAPDPTAARLSASPNRVVADGTASSALVVHLVDAYGNPVAGLPVAFADAAGGGYVAPPSTTTDAQGDARASVVAVVAGDRAVVAQAGNLTLTATVSWRPGPAAAATSTLLALPPTAVADGNAAVTLSLLARDAYGNPVPAAATVLSASGAPLALGPPPGAASVTGSTDAAGALTSSARTTVAGGRTLTATVAGVPVFGAVSFVAGPPDPNHSRWTVAPPQAVADGNAALLATLLLADAWDNPAPGLPVTFTPLDAGLTLDAPTGVTDADGRLSVRASATVAGGHPLAARVAAASGNVIFSTTLSLTAGPASPATSTWSSDVASATADGVAPLVLTLQLRDAYGNAVANVAADLGADGPDVTWTPLGGITDANGALQFVARGTVAGVRSLRVQAGAVALDLQVTLLPGPPDPAQSALVGDAGQVVADGASSLRVDAVLRDAFGNPVPGQTVNLASDAAGDTFFAADGTALGSGGQATDAAGAVAAGLRGTRAGSRTVTASFTQGALAQLFTFVAGAPDGGRSSFTVAPAPPNHPTADGNVAARLVLTVADRYGNGVAGAPVAILVTGTANALDAAQGVTDATGTFVTALRTTVAEAKALTASFGPASLGANVTFVAGPPVRARSALVASPDRVVADGTSAATLVASFADAFGNPCPGLALTFGVADPAASVTPPGATTDGGGTASTSLTSTRAGSVVGSAAVQLPQGGTLQLVAPVRLVAGAPSAARSSLAASPNGTVADGTSAAAITLQLRDAAGNPTPGVALHLSSADNAVAFAVADGNTAADGAFVTTATSTAAGARAIGASFGGTSLTTTVPFVAGAPASATSSVTASPSQAVADGLDVVTLTVQVADAFANPVSGARVGLAVGGSNNLLGAPTGTTTAAGTLTTTLRSTRAQTKAVTATAGGASVGTGVRFVAGSPTTQSVRWLTDGRSAVADGNDAASLSLSVQDPQGNPVVGQAVAFAGSGNGLVLTPTDGATAADGTLALQVRATRAGVATVRAQVGNVVVVQAVSFAAGPPDPNHCALTAQPNQAVANGNDAVALTLVLRDALDNLVANVPVTFSPCASCGPFVVQAADAKTSAAGVATARVVATQAQTTAVEAQFAGLRLSAPLRFVAGPVANTGSSFGVSPGVVVANGSSVATLSAVLADALGNPVGGATVWLDDGYAVDAFAQRVLVTDATGLASTTLGSTLAGGRTVVAQVQNTSLSAPLLFVPGPPDAGASRLFAEPNTVVADANGGSTLTLSLRDAYANPIPGASVSFSADDTGVSFLPNAGTTDAAGNLQASARSTLAGARTAVASVNGTALTAGVTFTAGPPSAARSSLFASPSTLTADGNQACAVRVVLRDAYDNPVPGQAVVLSVGGSGNGLDANAGVTDAVGSFVASLTSTRAEAKALGAQARGASLAAQVRFVAGSATSQTVQLTASPAVVVANDVDRVTLRMQATDLQLNPIVGTPVTFSADRSGVTVDDPNANTDAAGQANAVLHGTRAGSLQAAASVQNVTVQAAVVLIAGPPAAAQSTFVAAPSSATADGNGAVVASLSLRDAYGNAADNVRVSFSVVGGNVAMDVAEAQTDATGAAKTTLRSTLAAAKALTASFAGQQLSLSANFVAGPVANATSSFVAAPTPAVADGNARVALSFFGRDAQNNPTVGRTLSLAVTNGAAQLDGNTLVTDANGWATTGIVSTVADTKAVVASVDGTSFTASPAFVAGPPSAANSSFVASANSVVAGSPASLLVRVRDAFGNPVGQQAVAWTSTVAGDAFAPNAATTDAAGTATTSVSGTLAQTRTLTAQAGPAALQLPLVVEAGSPNANWSALTPLPTSQVADNVATVAMTALIGDRFGNPVGNQPVSFSTSGAGWSFAPPSATTDASGTATSALRSTRSGTQLATVTAGPASVSAPVTFTAGSPNASRSFVYGAPQSASVDDANGVTVVAAVRDAFDNAVGGANVRLNAASGNAFFLDPNLGVTPADGNYLARLRCTAATGVSVTAALDGPASSMPVVFTFAPGVATDLSLAVQPNTALADGNASVTLGARPKDAFGNPTVGASVTFVASGSNNTFSAPTATVDAGGLAATALRSTRSQAQTVVASAGNANASVAAYFTGGRASAANSTLSFAAATGTVADRVATSTATFQLAAVGGGTVVNQPVRLGGRFGELSFSPAVVVTDGNGRGSATVASALAGQRVVELSCGNVVVRGAVGFAPRPGRPVANLQLPGPPLLSSGPASSGHQAAAVHDVDGDGLPDLLLASYAGRKVSVALNQGNAIFAAAATFDVPQAPTALALADYTHDGLDDLLVATKPAATPGGLFALPNLGNGLFGAPLVLLASGGGGGVAAADFNEDGHADVVASGRDGTGMRVWLGTAGGSFSSPRTVPASAGAYLLAAGDIDGDQHVDVVASDVVATNVQVFFGAGNGNFAAASNVPVGAEKSGSVALVDLDGDGLLDLVVGSNGGQSVYVALARAGRTFAPVTSYSVGAGVAQVALADVDHDGRQDVVVAQADSGSLGVLLGRAGGTLASAAPALLAAHGRPSALAAADLNLDGFDDVVFGPGVGAALAGVALGDGRWVGAYPQPVGARPHGVVVADLDGDGLPDAVVANANDATLTVLRNVNGKLAPSVTLQALGAVDGRPGVGDVDQDGVFDLLVANPSGPNATLFRGTGSGAFAAGTAVALPAATRSLQVADLNGDGAADLVAVNAAGGVRVMLGRGTGSFATGPVLSPGVLAYQVQVADFDGDGVPDVAASGANVLLVYRGSGDGNFGAPYAPQPGLAGPAYTDLAVGDVDGDGLADVVVQASNANASLLFLGQASAAAPLVAAGSVQLASSGRAVALADINGDGLLDHLATNSAQGLLQLNLGSGNGTFGGATYYPIAAGAYALAVADLDQDGAVDLLCVADGGLDGYAPPASQQLWTHANRGWGNLPAGRPVAQASSWTASPPSQSTDAGNAIALSATLADVYGTVVPAQPLALFASGSNVVLGAFGGVSSGAGSFGTTVASSTVQSAWALLRSGTLVAAVPIAFTVGAPASATSSLALSANTTAANVPVTATALVQDARGVPVPGANVAFGATGSNNTFGAASGTTDANGLVSTSVAATLAQSENVVATVAGNFNVNAALTVVAGSPNAAASSLTAATSPVTAGTSVQLVLTVRDAFGNPAPGQVASFGASSPNDTFGAASGPSAADGTVTVLLTPRVAGTSRPFNANVTGAGVVATTLSVGPAAAAAATSSLTLTPNASVAGSAVSVAAVFRDAFGNPASGASVSFAADGGSNSFTSSAAVADGNGRAQAQLVTTLAQVQNVTATSGAATVRAALITVAASPNASLSVLASSPNAAPATGFATVPAVATLRDAYGNLVLGATVTFSSPGTSVRLPVVPSRTTDGAGTARIDAASVVAQSTTLVASFSGGSLAQNVVFAAPTATSQANSTFVVANAQGLVADGNVGTLATFTARDANGNALPYRGVSLQSPTNNLSFVPAMGATDANGVFTSWVRTSVSGPAVVWARSGAATLSAATTALPRANVCREVLRMGGGAAGTRTPTSRPYAVLAADLDADGAQDFVAAGDNNVVIVFNPGGGANRSVKVLPGGLQADQLAAADLDGDGKLDLVRTSRDSNQIFYFLGQGGGNFAAGVGLSLTGNTAGMVAKDFDGDGKVDLALVDNTNFSVNIFRNTGSPGWTQVQSLPVGTALAAMDGADANGDGILDLAVTNRGGNAVLLFWGNGNASFSLGRTLAASAQPTSVRLVDLNADGKVDVLWGSRSDPRIGVALGQSGGNFGAATYYTCAGTAAQSLAVGDFNKDGILDVAAGSGVGISVWLGSGSGLLQAGAPLTFGASLFGVQPEMALTAADFTGDGNLDLMYASADGQRVALLPGRGDGTFVAGLPQGLPGGQQPTFVAAGDLDGDGVVDLVTANDLQRTLTWLRGSGDGNFSVTKTYTVAASYGVRHVTIADLNLDGVADLVACDASRSGPNSASIDVFLGTGGGNMAAPVSYAVGSTPLHTAVADLNGDGLPDVVCTTYSSGGIYRLLGDGTGALGAAASSGPGSPSWTALADVNGDGWVDALAPTSANGRVNYYRNDGTGTFSYVNYTFVYGNLSLLVARDFTGDGKVDFIVSNPTNPAQYLGVGNGSGSFSVPPAVAPRSGSTELVTADFDGDGRLDFVEVDRMSLGNGNGSFRGPLSFPAPSGSQGSAVADFNGDGQPDYAVVSGATNQVFVYLNGGCNAPLPAGVPSGATSDVVVSPAPATASNVNNATVLARARDANGLALANVGVVLVASGQNDTFGATSGVTDANGNFSTTFSSTLAQVQNLVVTLGGRAVTSVSVTTVAAPPASATSTLVATPAGGVVANGNAAASLVATVRDAYGNPAGNQNVVFAGPGAVALSPASGVTDANGTVASSARSTVAQQANVTVTAGGGQATATVTFVAGPASGNTSLLVAQPNAVVADNSGASALVGQLRDAFGNPCANQTATLARSGTNLTISPNAAVAADANGRVSWNATSPNVQTASFALMQNANGLGSATVSFTLGPPSAANSSFVASPNAGLVADGNHPSGLSGTVRDAQGRALPGQRVALSLAGATGPGAVVTNANGQFTTSAGSVRAGTNQFVARCGSAALAANVTFVAATPTCSGNFLLGVPPGPSYLQSFGDVGRVRAAKFDADAYPDAVVAINSGSANNVVVVRGGAAGLATTPTTVYAVVGMPQDFVFGDFDRDGTLDLAVASTGNALSIVQQPNRIDTYTTPFVNAGLCTGDVNGDNFNDVVLLAASPNAGYTAFTNGGNGTFGAGAYAAVGASASGCVLADLDGDGVLDLGLLDGTGALLRLLRGAGNGTFAAWQSLATCSKPQGATLLAADLDKDGRLDLGVACNAAYSQPSGNYFSWWRNGPGGAFGGPNNLLTKEPTNGAVAVDVNKDGNVDVMLSAATGHVLQLMGTGSGAFSSVKSIGVTLPPTAFDVADFNQDGNLDLVVGSNPVPLNVVYAAANNVFPQVDMHPLAELEGATTYIGGDRGDPGAPKVQALGDINRDGRTDFAYLGSKVPPTVYLSVGDFNYVGYQPAVTDANFSPGAFAMAGGDFLGTGNRTVLAAGWSNAAFCLFANSGNGTVAPCSAVTLRNFDTVTGWIDIVAGDINNDGLDDVVGLDYNGTLPIYGLLSRGDGTFATGPSIDPTKTMASVASTSTSISLVDLDNNGTNDLVVETAANVYLWKNDGSGTFSAAQTLSAPAAVFGDFRLVPGLGDLNGDGFVDLVCPTSYDVPAIFVNDRTGSMAAANTPSSANTGYRTQQVLLLDLDQDGRLDLVAGRVRTGYTNYGAVRLARGAGDATFGTGADYVTQQPRMLVGGRGSASGAPTFVLGSNYQKPIMFAGPRGCAP